MITAIIEQLRQIPGFKATSEHVSLLEAILKDRDEKIAQLKADLAAANQTITGLNEKLLKLDSTGFKTIRGLLWLRDGDAYESNPYCPKCKVVMGAFPPQTHWVCSYCNGVFDWCRTPAVV
jgi:hypothetical protein